MHRTFIRAMLLGLLNPFVQCCLGTLADKTNHKTSMSEGIAFEDGVYRADGIFLKQYENMSVSSLHPYANRTNMPLDRLRELGVCDKTKDLPWLDDTQNARTEAVIWEWARRNYSRVEQFSFFHLPKCAGSSMTSALVTAANECGITPCKGRPHADVDIACQSSSSQLSYGHQYMGLVDAARSRGLSAYYFTVLRHPVSRVTSLYRYIRSSPSHRLFSRVKEMTLPEFARLESVASNGMTRRFCGPKSGPVAAQCATDRRFALRRAKRHLLDEFALVGLQECYNESTALLSHLLPWVDESLQGLKVFHENNMALNVLKASTGKEHRPLIEGRLSPQEHAEVVARNEW